jgi:predicted acylesterase/phospholipase RssA
LKQILDDADYRKFTDYGFGGRARGFVNQLWQRGLAPGRYFKDWLTDHLTVSPLAKTKNTRELRFRDVVRADLPEDLTDEERGRARYRLRVIGSDISSGRMLVLPDDIDGFKRGKTGPDYEKDELLLVDAARMSMSYPYLYTPVTLYGTDARPHFVVEGGPLSNFSGSSTSPARSARPLSSPTRRRARISSGSATAGVPNRPRPRRLDRRSQAGGDARRFGSRARSRSTSHAQNVAAFPSAPTDRARCDCYAAVASAPVAA